MKAFSVLLPAVLAALIAAPGCGDDDDDDTGGAGTGGGTPGTGGSGGTNGAAQCEGVYQDKTEAELASEAGDGACTEDSDIAAVCANDINTLAASCGLSCFAQGGDEAAQLACNLTCINGMTNPDPSTECVGCYLASVACARMNCTQQCINDPTAEPCIQCRIDEGCTPGFYTCSGLPVPTGLDLGGGGQGEGGGANGGAGGN